MNILPLLVFLANPVLDADPMVTGTAYDKCVDRESVRLSKGRDSASDVATAVLKICEENMRWYQMSITRLAPERSSEADQEELRNAIEATARKRVIAKVVDARAR